MYVAIKYSKLKIEIESLGRTFSRLLNSSLRYPLCYIHLWYHFFLAKIVHLPIPFPNSESAIAIFKRNCLCPTMNWVRRYKREQDWVIWTNLSTFGFHHLCWSSGSCLPPRLQGSKVSKVSKGLCLSPKLQGPGPVVWLEVAPSCFEPPCWGRISWLGFFLRPFLTSFADAASISACSEVRVWDLQSWGWWSGSSARQVRPFWPSISVGPSAVWTLWQTGKTPVVWFCGRRWGNPCFQGRVGFAGQAGVGARVRGNDEEREMARRRMWLAVMLASRFHFARTLAHPPYFCNLVAMGSCQR